MITIHIKIKIVSLSLIVYFLFFKAPRKKISPLYPTHPYSFVHYISSVYPKDNTTNKKMTKSSNNKIACIFEDISLRTYVN